MKYKLVHRAASGGFVEKNEFGDPIAVCKYIEKNIGEKSFPLYKVEWKAGAKDHRMQLSSFIFRTLRQEIGRANHFEQADLENRQEMESLRELIESNQIQRHA